MNRVNNTETVSEVGPADGGGRPLQPDADTGCIKEKRNHRIIYPSSAAETYPICDEADYNIRVSLAWNGSIWQAVDLEAGDTAAEHYGYAADLGSTTVVVRLVNCSDGTVLAEESEYNRQTAYGTDILTRIFACKDKPEVLQDIRACTMETFTLLFEKLRQKTGIVPSDVLSMVVSGNTTMIHFLLGLDPFCVFSSPYAVRWTAPDSFRRKRWDFHEGMCLLRAGKIQLPGR